MRWFCQHATNARPEDKSNRPASFKARKARGPGEAFTMIVLLLNGLLTFKILELLLSWVHRDLTDPRRPADKVMDISTWLYT